MLCRYGFLFFRLRSSHLHLYSSGSKSGGGLVSGGENHEKKFKCHILCLKKYFSVFHNVLRYTVYNILLKSHYVTVPLCA